MSNAGFVGWEKSQVVGPHFISVSKLYLERPTNEVNELIVFGLFTNEIDNGDLINLGEKAGNI